MSNISKAARAARDAIVDIQPTDADRHWAAGLFEGEGTITIGVRNLDDTYRLVACMGNTDADVVAFFQSRWPGWVQPFYGERVARKAGSMWTRAGPRAEAFVRELLPFFRCARVRRKAQLGLRLRACQHEGGRGSHYKAEQRIVYLAMRELNARGASSVTDARAVEIGRTFGLPSEMKLSEDLVG